MAGMPPESIQITRAQAQTIIDAYKGDSSEPIEYFEQLQTGYHNGSQPYLIQLSNPTPSFILTVACPSPSDPESETPPSYAPNTLEAQHSLLTHLHANAPIPPLPFPIPLVLCTSPTPALPYEYLLSSLPYSLKPGMPLSAARERDLSARQQASADLRLGAHLKALHALENDWFGPPALEADGLFVWQEAFALLFEEALDAAAALDAAGTLGLRGGLPVNEIRTYLSRAIGFFLFDDVEVPSLVWFTGSEEDIVVEVQEDEVTILGLLGFARAMWGDPLQERLFRVDPKPSAAFWEGYGGDPVVFQKQETKELWYNLYEALVVLVQNAEEGSEEGGPKVEWAKEAVPASIATLQEAKNYTQQK